MEEVLIILIQFLFEFGLDILLNLPFNWPSKNRTTPESDSILILCIIGFFGAIFMGWLSLFVFKYSIISSPHLRMANLFLAPIASAKLSQAIAKKRAESNNFIIPRNHFWLAFWFTLGFTIVRFAYARHTSVNFY